MGMGTGACRGDGSTRARPFGSPGGGILREPRAGEASADGWSLNSRDIPNKGWSGGREVGRPGGR